MNESRAREPTQRSTGARLTDGRKRSGVSDGGARRGRRRRSVVARHEHGNEKGRMRGATRWHEGDDSRGEDRQERLSTEGDVVVAAASSDRFARHRECVIGRRAALRADAIVVFCGAVADMHLDRGEPCPGRERPRAREGKEDREHDPSNEDADEGSPVSSFCQSFHPSKRSNRFSS